MNLITESLVCLTDLSLTEMITVMAGVLHSLINTVNKRSVLVGRKVGKVMVLSVFSETGTSHLFCVELLTLGL